MRKQRFIPNKNVMSKLAFVLAFIMMFNVFASVLPAAAYAADTDTSVINEEEPSEPILAYDITRLSIAGIEGDIDQVERTITFTVPEDAMIHHPDFGRQLRGSLTGFEAVSDPLIFYVGGRDWTVVLGNVAGVATGDTVRLEGGLPYTIIVEEIPAIIPGQITRLVIDRFEGVIDQDAATITFRIPYHLMNNDLFRGVIENFEAGDADELLFSIWGQELPFREGEPITFLSDVLVHVEGGVVYTIIIEPFEPYVGQITQLTLDEFEGEIDQVARTIAFNIPSELLNNGLFGGIIEGFETDVDADELIFTIWGLEVPFGEGDRVTFASGAFVSVADGIVYTLIINEILPVVPGQITRLVIDRFEGEVDQEAATITFRVPSHLLNENRFRGVVTDFEAGDADELIFVIWEQEWTIGQGNWTDIITGDLVYVEGGVVYTLIIEELELGIDAPRITQLRIGGVEGIIDQDERTITFDIPYYLSNNGIFSGSIENFETDVDDVNELIFVIWGQEWPLTQNSWINFDSGEVLVYVADGVVYRIIIVHPSPICPIIVEGQFYERLSGSEELNYSHITDWSHWRICEDGTLEIDGGFVHWQRYLAPWEDVRVYVDGVMHSYSYSHHITDVVITGSIEAGSELRSLFSRLENVTEINGLSYLNTSATRSMENMFRNSTSLIRLDLSVLDTSNVTNMERMFTNTRALRELTLGEGFVFIDNAGLPNLSHGTEYTGMWQNGEFIFTSAQLMNQFDGATMAGTFVWQVWENDDVCEMIASGRFAHQAIAESGVAGAAWRLCEDGTLEIDEGFINWTLYNGPWHNYRNDITDIVITGPITAGPSLRSLFRDLNYVTEIEGLTYFDTSRTTSMENMFRTSTGITELDLSSFDSSNVTNMHRMFTNMHALEYVNFGENFTPADNSGLPAHLRP